MRRERRSHDCHLTRIYSLTYARVLRSRCSWLFCKHCIVPFPISSRVIRAGINRFSFWTPQALGLEKGVLCDYITRMLNVCPLLSWHGRQILAHKKRDFRAGGKHLERALLYSLDIYARFSASANSRLIYCAVEKSVSRQANALKGHPSRFAFIRRNLCDQRVRKLTRTHFKA